jgi:hypothetical protein
MVHSQFSVSPGKLASQRKCIMMRRACNAHCVSSDSSYPRPTSKNAACAAQNEMFEAFKINFQRIGWAVWVGNRAIV